LPARTLVTSGGKSKKTMSFVKVDCIEKLMMATSWLYLKQSDGA